MAMRRVTVFGGSGFVGRYVVERLADRDIVVTVPVRDPEAAKFLRPLGQVGQVTPVACDIRDRDAVARAVAGSDGVINLVGVLAPRGKQSFAALHVEGPATIARAASAAGARRLVHVSALGASARGLSEYARSKAAGETAVREAFQAATMLRPSIVFGPEDGFFNLFGALTRFVPALPLFGGGTTYFQPVYVGDVATAIVNALGDEAASGKTYELGGPAVYSFAELMQIVLRETRRERLLVPVPFFVGDIMGAVLGLAPQPLLTRDQMRSLRTDNVITQGAHGLGDLGVQATALEAILPTYMYRYRRGGRLGRAPITD